MNTSILKVYFKYTSKFEKKYINLENLLPVYFEFEHKYMSLESLIEVYF